MSEERTTALVACATCSMPVKVVFEGDEPVEVFAVCGHPKLPSTVTDQPTPEASINESQGESA